VNILIVDDQELSRAGLRYGLQDDPDIESILEVENGQEAIGLIDQLAREQKHLPDLVLMDISMPTMNGIVATRHLKKAHPDLKILMLTSSSIPKEAVEALNAGANGFCFKNVKLTHLSQIMNVILSGGVWLESSIATALTQISTPASSPLSEMVMHSASGEPSDSKAPDKGMMDAYLARVQFMEENHLTAREWDVLKLLAQGKSNKEIAQELVVTIHTIKIHVSNIIQKLQVTDRTQAVIKVLQYC
jgi:DNA-binding NarL/FixJ family response regulator